MSVKKLGWLFLVERGKIKRRNTWEDDELSTKGMRDIETAASDIKEARASLPESVLVVFSSTDCIATASAGIIARIMDYGAEKIWKTEDIDSDFHVFLAKLCQMFANEKPDDLAIFTVAAAGCDGFCEFAETALNVSWIEQGDLSSGELIRFSFNSTDIPNVVRISIDFRWKITDVLFNFREAEVVAIDTGIGMK